MRGYGLEEERNNKIGKALTKFRETMGTEGLSGFHKALQIRNIQVSMENDLTKLNPSLVALIKFGKEDDENKSSIIYISKNINDYDLFFYLAHEVGHHMMHYVPEKEFIQLRFREIDYLDYFDSLPKEEQEAEIFAYNLLMPEEKFIEVYNIIKNIYGSRKEKVIEELSKYFFTGKEFVEKRIEYLIV